MKNTHGFIFFAIIIALAFCLSGCSLITGQGETVSETNIRHIRQLEVEKQMLIDDIDATLHGDRPSRLTDMHVR